jgi:DNA-binding response OmpR family regulator
MNDEQRGAGRGRLLVVDDDRGILAFIREALADEGYEVQTVSSGEDAMRAVHRKRPDLILLDINLPGVDGWDVLSRLRDAAGPQVPVVVMTAGYNAQEQALATGAQGYLGKPFDLDDLMNAVEAHAGLAMQGAHEASRLLESVC